MKKIVIISIISLIAIHLSAQDNFPVQEKYKLKNGMTVIFMEYGPLPITSVSFFVNTGKKNETPGQQFLSGLTSEFILLGNTKYNRVQQDSLSNILGAAISAFSNDNYTAIGMQFLNKDAGTAMDLLSGVMLQPTFPNDEITDYIGQVLRYNSPAKMDIGSLDAVFSRLFVFGESDPLGRSFYSKQLNKITAGQVKEFYKFNYTPKNTTLVISGKPDKEALKAMIEKYFGPWQAEYGEVNGVSLPEPEISKKEYAFVNRTNATQAALSWVKKAPHVNSKDQVAFEVANNVFTVMLMKTIREKEGKTYGIGSRYTPANNNGIFSVSTQVRSEVMYATLQSFDKVLQKLYDSGAAEEYLESARTNAKTGYLSAEEPEEIIQLFNPVIYPDYEKRKQYLLEIDKIDLARVNKIIKKYFTPDSYKVMIAGDEKVLGDQLTKIPGLVKLPLTAIEVDN